MVVAPMTVLPAVMAVEAAAAAGTAGAASVDALQQPSSASSCRATWAFTLPSVLLPHRRPGLVVRHDMATAMPAVSVLESIAEIA